MQTFTTSTSEETKKLAARIAASFQGGEILCLSGDLGAGKTTFAQGLLEALGAEGPYTSPTFTIMKNYQPTTNNEQPDQRNSSLVVSRKLSAIYHIDAYRIGSDDLRELGWNDFAGKPTTVTIVEWPENVSGIIPPDALSITFTWIDENRRGITLNNFEI